MVKKILLGLLVTCACNNVNASGLNIIDSTNKSTEFLNNIIGHLSEITVELGNENARNATINHCLNDMVYCIKSIINKLIVICGRPGGIITRNHVIKIIELYCDTIDTYNISEKRISRMINKKQSDNTSYITLIKNLFQLETNNEIDTETKLLASKYSKYMKHHLENVKDKLKIIISFMLNSIKDNNDFERIISYLYNDLYVLALHSNKNHELKELLYHEIKIDINNRNLYFPINNCKTLYDIIFAYKVYNIVDRIASKKYASLSEQMLYSKFESALIYNFDGKYLTDNTKQILNDIIQSINTKYNTSYELYTENISDNYGSSDITSRLYITQKNYYNLINAIRSILRTCNFPLTLKENENFIKLYANKPYYSSVGSQFPKSCEYIYDLIVSYFLNRVMAKLNAIFSNNHNINQITLIEFPNNANEIIEHLKPIIKDIFTSGNYNDKYDLEMQDNKLVMKKKMSINKQQGLYK